MTWLHTFRRGNGVSRGRIRVVRLTRPTTVVPDQQRRCSYEKRYVSSSRGTRTGHNANSHRTAFGVARERYRDGVLHVNASRTDSDSDDCTDVAMNYEQLIKSSKNRRERALTITPLHDAPKPTVS